MEKKDLIEIKMPFEKLIHVLTIPMFIEHGSICP